MMTAVRPDRRISTTVTCVIVAGALSAGINVFHTFGPIHLHNDGPLGPLSGASFSLDPPGTNSGQGPWTTGYELCLEQGTDPVILESITPASNSGTGLDFLGAVVRQLHPGIADALGEETGYPPRVSEVLHPFAGYAVTQQCDSSGGQPNGQPQVTTELDVGIGKPAHSTGGGWSGLTVAYRVGATQYVATWDTGFYICGPTAPAAAGCTQPS